MAEDLLEAVERLQSRLSENQEPRKLMKTLKKLGELPMTVDILVETGVGKTVNSLRKHDLAGDIAKTLVAKWKKLVPQSADRPSNPREERTHSHPRSDIGGDVSRKRARERSPVMAPCVGEEEEEEEEEEEMEVKRGYRTNYSPSPPPPRHHYSPPQLSHGGAQRGGYQSEGYDSHPEEDPDPEPEPEPEPEPSPPPRKEARHSKPHREPSRGHGDRDEERRRRHAQTSSGGGGGGGSGSEGKKRSAESDAQPGGAHKASKHSRHSTPHDSRKEKKGGSGSDGRQREHRDSLPAELDGEERFDAPTMSFESFLTYDAPTPTKKKKKAPPPPTQPSSSRPSQASQPTPAPSSSSKPSKANGTRSKRPEPSPSPMADSPVPEKRRRVVEAVPSLPDIPLPAIQPNYRPLPSIDLVTPLSPQRRKVPVANDEEDTGFTGRRMNSKMVVYSGAKTTYLPKMMSLYEQCIRVLQNNIDSIDEVGGVPFEILEPVLERCTPEQLYRIEQCNQCFMEDSDELWLRHCQRDFKRASPQEYESWREMYLRLHEEREERLRMLTQNISSAHAQKPKGRQVKMAFVNSAAKPPRDVKRRQDKFGTSSTSTASSTAAAAPIKIRPAVSYSSNSADTGGSSSTPSHYSPPQASRSSGPSGGAPNPSRDKPQVKKIAPMMAKTIKAFKNRFSRR